MDGAAAFDGGGAFGLDGVTARPGRFGCTDERGALGLWSIGLWSIGLSSIGLSTIGLSIPLAQFEGRERGATPAETQSSM